MEYTREKCMELAEKVREAFADESAESRTNIVMQLIDAHNQNKISLEHTILLTILIGPCCVSTGIEK